MFFRFDAQKAIQAASVLLRFDPTRQMSRKRLLALLYLADRAAIKETGRPIIGGHPVAMDHGPIHSEVYDLIKGGTSFEQEWSEHFQNSGYKLELTHDPGILSLSRYEIGKLNELSETYANKDEWEVANVTHDLPEYEKNYVVGTSKKIPLEDIIEHVGRGADKEAILKDAQEKALFDSIFHGMIV